MYLFINLLIAVFIFIISYQLFLAGTNGWQKNIEGLETQTYQDYDMTSKDNSMILPQQNSGNIQVLKGQVDDLLGLDEKVTNNRNDINTLQIQMADLMEAQQSFAEENQPGPAPEMDTLITDDTDDTDDTDNIDDTDNMDE